MKIHLILDPRSQSEQSEDRSDALRILSEYVRSFDTDPQTDVPLWKSATPPYNQAPIFIGE